LCEANSGNAGPGAVGAVGVRSVDLGWSRGLAYLVIGGLLSSCGTLKLPGQELAQGLQSCAAIRLG